MKWKIIYPIPIAVFIMSIVSVAKAQPFQSLFSYGEYPTTWTHLWRNVGPSGMATSRYLKDTTIHGVTYKKVGLVASIFDFSGGLFREDTLTGKVWYRDIRMTSPMSPEDTMDRLAFDFGLQVGDSFDLSCATNGLPDSYYPVDSVRIVNGLKHIYFSAQYRANTLAPWEPITFIEGVGSNLGVFWKHGTAGNGVNPDLYATYLICSYKNGTKTPYENKAYYGDCHPNVDIRTLPSQTSEIPFVYLYPQPAKRTVKISNSSGLAIRRVQWINFMGQVVHTASGDDLKHLDIEGILPGHYAVQLFSNQGLVASTLLVITR